MRSCFTVGVCGFALSGCMLVFDGGPDSEPDDPPSIHPRPDNGAACDAPDGPAVALTSDAVATAISGRWWKCAGADEFHDHAMELTADLHFYLLTDVNGEFVRNLGPSSSGTYRVNDRPAGIEFAIEQHWGDGLDPSYPLIGYLTRNPRKMQLGGGRYVAIP